METITLEPLRWQEDPSRIIIQAMDSHPEVYYQVTGSRFVEGICCGRPVEELPRLVTILGPAHHLTAALALDRLFQAAPPEMAQNMRSALLQAQYCTAHLRKIFFFMTGCQCPFTEFRASGRRPGPARISRRFLEKIMHQVALALEAEEILGGRHDHPLTAVAGGVSRSLKEGHTGRLAAISEALLSFSRELADFMMAEILTEGGLLEPWSHLEIPALACLHLADDDQPILTNPQGSDGHQIKADQLGQVVAFRQEPWTYQAFAYLKEKGWQGVESSPGFFYVGPLARFNAGQAAGTPLAEKESQRIMACLGRPPVYKLTAAFGALVVEFLQAAEKLQSLSTPEKLTGPTLRTIPQGQAAVSTWAALETPQGLSWHGYQVDDKGIVQAATIIDSRAANNALKCLLAKEVVGAGLKRKEDPAVMKERLAVALLPF